MLWEGRVEVATAGTNPAAFKPVGTTGSVWGEVQIHRATTAVTWPLGMPMREYFIGGDKLGGFYRWQGDAEVQPNWEMKVRRSLAYIRHALGMYSAMPMDAARSGNAGPP